MRKIIAILMGLMILLSFCACDSEETTENPYEKYAKYEELFEYLEAGDYERANSYLQDYFGIELVPAKPPTEPTKPPTEPTEPPTEPTKPPTEPAEPPTESTEPFVEPTEAEEDLVWIPQSGTKYHSRSNCSNMKNPTQVTKTEAEEQGYTPCKRCH